MNISSCCIAIYFSFHQNLGPRVSLFTYFLEDKITANTVNLFFEIIISTLGKIVVNTIQNDLQELKSLKHCSCNDADTRSMLHILHCAEQGY